MKDLNSLKLKTKVMVTSGSHAGETGTVVDATINGKYSTITVKLAGGMKRTLAAGWVQRMKVR